MFALTNKMNNHCFSSSSFIISLSGPEINSAKKKLFIPIQVLYVYFLFLESILFYLIVHSAFSWEFVFMSSHADWQSPPPVGLSSTLMVAWLMAQFVLCLPGKCCNWRGGQGKVNWSAMVTWNLENNETFRGKPTTIKLHFLFNVFNYCIIMLQI